MTTLADPDDRTDNVPRRFDDPTAEGARSSLAARSAEAFGGTRTQRLDALLADRQGAGILWAIRARLIYVTLGGAVVLAVSPNLFDTVGTVLLLVVVMAVNLRAVRWIERGQRELAANVGIGLDIVCLIYLPFSWMYACGGPEEVPLAFLVKNDLPFVGCAVVALNTLALRPRDPLIVMGALILEQLVFLAVAGADPRTTFTTEPIAAHLGASVHVGFFFAQLFSLVMVGLFLTAASTLARRAVRRVVEVEVDNTLMKQRQAALITEGKMAALSRLVAGVTHEVNSPLGAVKSGAQTARLAATKLLEADEARRERVAGTLTSTLDNIDVAARRLDQLVGSLREFSHLDQAEWVRGDLRRGLEATLQLLPAELLEDTEVVRDFADDLPHVLHRPQQINQVLLTLVENALEAMGTTGTLTLRLRGTATDIILTVADTGPGVPRDRVAGLFELSFEARQGRVGMGFGLPVGRAIVLQHGGDLRYLGGDGGAVFELRLPIAGPER